MIFFPVHSSGRKRCFCSFEPYFAIGAVPRPTCADAASAVLAHAVASSSTIVALQSEFNPMPPYSSGNGTPSSCNSASRAQIFGGICCCSSICFDSGFNSERANAAAVSRTAVCSSETLIGVNALVWDIAELL
jgi:hypothetical protein